MSASGWGRGLMQVDYGHNLRWLPKHSGPSSFDGITVSHITVYGVTDPNSTIAVQLDGMTLIGTFPLRFFSVWSRGTVWVDVTSYMGSPLFIRSESDFRVLVTGNNRDVSVSSY